MQRRHSPAGDSKRRRLVNPWEIPDGPKTSSVRQGVTPGPPYAEILKFAEFCVGNDIKDLLTYADWLDGLKVATAGDVETLETTAERLAGKLGPLLLQQTEYTRKECAYFLSAARVLIGCLSKDGITTAAKLSQCEAFLCATLTLLRAAIREQTSDVLVSAVLENCVLLVANFKFPETVVTQLISVAFEALVSREPSVNITGAGAILSLFLHCPGARAAITAGVADVFPARVPDLTSEDSSVPTDKKKKKGKRSVSISHGISVHPVVLLLIRLCDCHYVIEEPESANFYETFKNRSAAAIAFCRSISADLTRRCLGHKKTPKNSEEGAQALAGLASALYTASSCPLTGMSAGLLLEHLCRALVRIVSRPESAAEGAFGALTAVLQQISRLENDVYTSAEERSNKVNALHCGSCGDLLEGGGDILTCWLCSVQTHRDCAFVNDDTKLGENAIWCCDPCALRRAAGVLFFRAAELSLPYTPRLKKFLSSLGAVINDKRGQSIAAAAETNQDENMEIRSVDGKPGVSMPSTEVLVSLWNSSKDGQGTESSDFALRGFCALASNDVVQFLLMTQWIVSVGPPNSSNGKKWVPARHSRFALASLQTWLGSMGKHEDASGMMVKAALVAAASLTSENVPAFAHTHTLIGLWRKQCKAKFEATQALIVGAVIGAVMENAQATIRRAAVAALGNVSGLLAPRALQGLFRASEVDTAATVREKAVAALETVTATAISKLRAICGAAAAERLLRLAVQRKDDANPLNNEKRFENFNISAFGTVSTASRETQILQEKSLAWAEAVLVSAARVALARLDDVSAAVRARAVKLAALVLLWDPPESPPLVDKLVGRLTAPLESRSISVEVASLLGNLWFTPDAASRIATATCEMASSGGGLPLRGEDSDELVVMVERSGGSAKSLEDENEEKTLNNSPQLEALVQGLLRFGEGNGDGAAGELLIGSNGSTHRAADLLDRLYISLKTRSRKKGDGTALGGCLKPTTIREVFNCDITPLQRVMLVGLINETLHSATLTEAVKCLLFALVKLFLKQHGTDGGSDIVRAICVLVHARPVRATELLLKHFGAYISELPRTARQADFVCQVLQVLSLSVGCGFRDASPERGLQPSCRELAFRAVTALILPSTRLPLICSSTEFVCLVSLRILTDMTCFVEPLLVESLACLFPLRDLVQCMSKEPGVTLLQKIMEVLLRHRQRSKQEGAKTVPFSITRKLADFVPEPTTRTTITVDKENQDLSQRQWLFVLEALKKKICLLGCLCRTIPPAIYDLRLEQSVEPEKEREEAEEESHTTDFRTPAPTGRRKSLGEIMEDAEESTNGSAAAATPQTPRNRNNANAKKHATQRLAGIVDAAADAAGKDCIAVSRLVRALLHPLTEEWHEVAPWVEAEQSDSGLPGTANCLAGIVPPALDKFAADSQGEIFNLMLDFLSIGDTLRKAIRSESVWLFETLEPSLSSFKAVALQGLGMFLLNHKQYTRSRRIRLVLSFGLRSWNCAALQWTALEMIGALLTAFESDTLAKNEGHSEDNATVGAQPLACHARDVAILVRGFAFENVNATNRDEHPAKDALFNFWKMPESQNGKQVEPTGQDEPGTIIPAHLDSTSSWPLRIIPPNNLKEEAAKQLQLTALTVLAKLVAQGLVNPHCVVESTFAMLFQPLFCNIACDILKDCSELSSPEILVINRLPHLMNFTFITKHVMMLNGGGVVSGCCPRCGLPDPFASVEILNEEFAGFHRYWENDLQGKRATVEKAFMAVIDCVERQLSAAAAYTIAGVLRRSVRGTLCGECGATRFITALRKTGFSTRWGLTEATVLVSICFQRWLLQLLCTLPLRTNLEALFAAQALAKTILQHSMFRKESPVPSPNVPVAEPMTFLNDNASALASAVVSAAKTLALRAAKITIEFRFKLSAAEVTNFDPTVTITKFATSSSSGSAATPAILESHVLDEWSAQLMKLLVKLVGEIPKGETKSEIDVRNIKKAKEITEIAKKFMTPLIAESSEVAADTINITSRKARPKAARRKRKRPVVTSEDESSFQDDDDDVDR